MATPAPVHFDAAMVAQLLPMASLVDALDRAFRDPPIVPMRMNVKGTDGRELLVMPAVGMRFAGSKLLTVLPHNAARGLPVISGIFCLFDFETGAPLATFDAGELTGRRTAAASAVAARHLARPDARKLLLLGAGHLIPFMAEAFMCVRPIDHVAIWARNPARAADAARNVTARLPRGIEVRVVTDLSGAVADADIVSAATRAQSPILPGAWLKDGTHVDLVGGYRPDMRETDDAAIQRCRLFVDDIAAARREAGDIVDPLARGVITPDAILGDLSALCRETVGRQTAAEITLYKSVGIASVDLIAASVAWEQRASERTDRH